MKQFAISGLGRFGSSVAQTLYMLGHDVLVVDSDAERVDEISDYVTHAVQADATDEGALKALGLRNFDVAVVTIGTDIQSSILITLLCKELGVKHVIAKAQNELHAKVLYKIGADKVVFPERDMGMRVAHTLVSNNILDFIELSPDYSMLEMAVMEDWIGYTLKDLELRNRYGINVIAIKRDNGIEISPNGNNILLSGDVLLVIGSVKDIRKLENARAD